MSEKNDIARQVALSALSQDIEEAVSKRLGEDAVYTAIVFHPTDDNKNNFVWFANTERESAADMMDGLLSVWRDEKPTVEENT